jgi:hypothetical protein
MEMSIEDDYDDDDDDDDDDDVTSTGMYQLIWNLQYGGGPSISYIHKIWTLSDELGRHVEKIFAGYCYIKSGTLNTGLQNL